MILRNGYDLLARYHDSKGIAKVYYGALLVWESVSSCFSGMWRNALPYKGKEGYLNNKR